METLAKHFYNSIRFSFQFQTAASEEVDVVKAVAAEEIEKREDDSDQVALESIDQDGPQSLHGHGFAHPPPPGPGRGNFMSLQTDF
jgi:predicted Zn-dependent peptidase